MLFALLKNKPFDLKAIEPPFDDCSRSSVASLIVFAW
jgi:hypothetical protein